VTLGATAASDAQTQSAATNDVKRSRLMPQSNATDFWRSANPDHPSGLPRPTARTSRTASQMPLSSPAANRQQRSVYLTG